MQSTRRYDIDWIRVIAIWFLLLYHIAIGFQPWGVLIRFIQNGESIEALKAPMYMLNVWRIPILFYISGMGVCFALRKRNVLELIKERSRRILLPFVFGMIALVPLHILLWQQYYHQDLSYAPGPGHLWFLGNIFVYVLICTPLFLHLKNKPEGRLSLALKRGMGSIWSPVVIVLAFVLEVLLVQPEAFEYYAQNAHGFFLGLIAFFFGFLIIHSGVLFWQRIQVFRWGFLVLALLLYLLRLLYFELQAPDYLMAIESNVWIFSILAFGYRHLNHPGAWLRYLSQAAYPVYILHMLFIYLASYLLFPLQWPAGLTFVLVTIITFGGCYGTYELIRRVPFLRPLFGLRNRQK